MEYPPISIICYSRLDKLKNLVQSLLNCHGAHNHEVYFFIDGPKAGDEKIINSVKSYCRDIIGFKSVTIFNNDVNNYDQNVSKSFKFPLEKHGKVILLEDDVVVGQSFLNFMTHNLTVFENSEQIFSISAECPRILDTQGFKAESQFWQIVNGSNIGLWNSKVAQAERWRSIHHPYERIVSNFRNIRKYCSIANFSDLLHLREIYLAKKTYYDALWGAYCFMEDKYTVFPSVSLCFNSGHDGSGLHCMKDETLMEPPRFGEYHPVEAISLDLKTADENTKKFVNRNKTRLSEIKALYRHLKN